jgi:hypothetical protein
MTISLQNDFKLRAQEFDLLKQSRLKETANKSGMLMLEHAFSEQLQALYDDEESEFGSSGYCRELMPMLVEEALKSSPHLGVGKEVFQELLYKTRGGQV